MVADASGLFVMSPAKLPQGHYRLTLRSTAPDGAVSLSRSSVPVTVSGAAPPVPEPSSRAATAEGNKRVAAPVGDTTGALALAAPPSSDRGPRRSKVETAAPAPGSRMISRGESLWLISRRIYGDGQSYALIYNANRDKLHHPDRNYPGQTIVLPPKTR